MAFMKNFTSIYEGAQEKVLACVERDANSLRLSALVAVQIEDGRISQPVSVTRSKLLSSGIGALRWLNDYREYYSDEALEAISARLRKLLLEPEKVIDTTDKATAEEVLERLLDFSKKCEELLSTDGIEFLTPNVFTRDDKIYIKTPQLTVFVKLNNELGWRRLEILKMLKRNNLLDTGTGRTYDKKIKVNGRSENFYVLKIDCSLELEDADEVVEIKEVGRDGR